MTSCLFSHSFLFALTFLLAYASSPKAHTTHTHTAYTHAHSQTLTHTCSMEWERRKGCLVRPSSRSVVVPVLSPAVAFSLCECVCVGVHECVGVCVHFKCACMRCTYLQCFYIECWLYKTTEQEKLIIQKRHRQTATETVDPTLPSPDSRSTVQGIVVVGVLAAVAVGVMAPTRCRRLGYR